MDFNRKISNVLEWLETNIDETHLEHALVRHVKALSFEPLDRPVALIGLPVEGLDPYLYVETYNDIEKMLYNELVACVPAVLAKDDSILSIRSNFGVGTMPSLFGTSDRITEEDSKPWVTHLSGSDVETIISNGLPDLNNGYGKQIFDAYRYYQEVLDAYPICKKHIHLTHPDLQGPFDIAHLLMGSDIYYKMYDDPKMVKALLSLVTETYIAFFDRINPLLTDKITVNDKAYCYQGRNVWGGNVVLRNDTAVNLSKEQYLEYAKPYDEQILEAVGEGSIHFCGRADQWIGDMFDTKHIRGINFGYMDSKYEFGQNLLDYIKPSMDETKVPIVGYYVDDVSFESFDFVKYNTGVTYGFSASEMALWDNRRDEVTFLM